MAPKKLKKDVSMKMPKAKNNMTATMRVKSNEEKKEAMKIINSAQGGSNVYKRRAFIGYQIPKLLKSNALDVQSKEQPGNQTKSLNSKTKKLNPSLNKDVETTITNAAKNSKDTLVSTPKSVGSSKINVQHEVEAEILKGIVENEGEPLEEKDIFYIDHKRNPLCRIIGQKIEKKAIVKDTLLNQDRNGCQKALDDKHFAERSKGRVMGVRKKKDPPLRITNTISREPPDVSSDEDVEEELRSLLEEQLRKNIPLSSNRPKNSLKHSELNARANKILHGVKNPNTPIKKRNIVRYAQRSRGSNTACIANEYIDMCGAVRGGSTLSPKIYRTRSESKKESVLDITPDVPGTPILINNEHNESYSKSDKEENVEFSPNTTLSGFQSLNYSLVGSSNEDDAKSSCLKKAVWEDSDDADSPNKTLQELNASFVDYLQEGECAQSCIKDDVPMDWDATDKTGILNELNQCREDLQQNSKSSILQDFPETVLNKSDEHERISSNSTIYVVVDTNIFIAQLRIVEKLFVTFVENNDPKCYNLKIYVPWAVFEELDKLKMAGKRPHNPNMELEINARKAISFLHQKLFSKSKKVVGQTQAEEQQAEIYKAYNADDRILRACLKLKSEGKSVLLYTNDRNLANKTLISGINAYDSTKIFIGITEVGLEIQTSARLDAIKTQNSLLKKSKSTDFDGNAQSELNETLFPDSGDEEDMVIDSDDNFVHESASAVTVATVTDLYKLFEDVWHNIYKYTCRYAYSLDLEDLAFINLPKPNPHELLPDLQPKDNSQHLDQLVIGVVQLAKYLNDLMKVSPTLLAVNTRELINFHASLTLFLPKLDRYKPVNYPSSPDHPPIRPSVMLNFALQLEYREKLTSGVNQLLELRIVLQKCKEKLATL